MRSVADHAQLIFDLIRPRAPESMALADAASRVLAEDVIAGRRLPPFDNSAMDGYAVRSADVAAAPVQLPVTEDIPAGRTDVLTLAPGTVHRIMTGAPLPAGADAVVPVEATDGGVAQVRVDTAVPVGNYIRRAGEDVAAGETVLRAGSVLGPAQLGLLAALGESTVRVIPPIRVTVLSTGSELVQPGRALEHGQIHESNGVMLAAAVRAAGGQARQIHFVPDDVGQFQAQFDGLNDCDLVLTSGGVSAGAFEVVKEALSGHGVEFAKVAMQPGMPQGAGVFRGTPVVTLPGNPVSSLVSFEVFVRPAMLRAMGHLDGHRPVVAARLTETIESPAGRRQFRRGFLDRTAGTVAVVGPPGSHFLRWLANADCLIDVPESITRVEAGSEVEAWLLD
jgi:molybdopterin molybdotransferase